MSFSEVLKKGYEPTVEDLAKQFTNEQLVKLCLRNRCRVDMWRWNVVDEFKLNFLEDGRFEGKSEKFKKKLLLKACHRYKERFKEREIDLLLERHEEWAYRKKYSLLQLELWEYDEAKEREDQTLMENDRAQQEFMRPLELNSNRKKFGNKEMDAKENANQVITKKSGVQKRGTLNISTSTECMEELVDVETEVEECAGNVQEKHQLLQSSQHSDGEHSLPRHLNIINSESLTLENITEEISTELSASDIQNSPEDLLITLSQLDEPPVQQIFFQHLQSRGQSPVLLATQSQSYDDFHERLPMSSTQDAGC